MVELMCAFVGETESSFPVEVDEKYLVGALKDAIKADNGDIKCDARKLQLYLAKKGDAWLTSEDADAATLDDHGKPPGFEKMNPSLMIKDIGHFGTNFRLKEQQIHVLVVVPSDDDEDVKRRRIAGAFTGVMMGTPAPTEIIESVVRPVIRDEKYMAVSAALLDKCGLWTPHPVQEILYFRREVYELWGFVEREVLADNATAFIVGPPGSGKSLATLCCVTQLDPRQWQVVWIHLGALSVSCLSMGSREYRYWKHIDESTFVLPRVAGKKLFVCLDGYTADPAHLAFLRKIRRGLTENERLVVCSAMATMGCFNPEDAKREKIRVFYMNSWTLAEYEAAVADAAFYEQIEPVLNATTDANQVNHDDGDDDGVQASEAHTQKKKTALARKFYYAGGSCRFMFQSTTDEVKQSLQMAVRSTTDETDLIRYCSGYRRQDTIDELYGMTGGERGRSPVSSYAASLCARESGEDTILRLTRRVYRSKDDPAIEGRFLEWLFLASVPPRAVTLVGDDGVMDELPRAPVLEFDPTKRFRVIQGRIMGDKSWLQPVVWNEGGYDAVYFDMDTGKVLFIQVTRSNTHNFKRHFFTEVLLKLEMAGMAIQTVEVYCVATPAQYLKFKMAPGDREDHVKVRALQANGL